MGPLQRAKYSKGDLPVWKDDWFYSIIAISDFIIEPRRFAIPVGVSTTSRTGSLDTIGRGETTIFAETLIIENVFYKGNTVFKPPDWEFHFTQPFRSIKYTPMKLEYFV